MTRNCFGTYDPRDMYCVENCNKSIQCLRFKTKVLLSCLPPDAVYIQAAKTLLIATNSADDEKEIEEDEQNTLE